MLLCGTPEINGRKLDSEICCLDRNKFHKVPVIARFHNLTRSLLCGTLSKALQKSM